MYVELVRPVAIVSREPVNQETPTGQDGDGSVGDSLQNKTTASAGADTIRNRPVEATDELLDSLSALEAPVVRMRFGIERKSDCTLEETGTGVRVIRERGHQVEARAVVTSQHPSRT